MGRFFLGKPVHWLAILVGLGVLGWTGTERLQVTGFNLYTLVVAVVSVALVGIVLATSRRGERVTRDPLPPMPEE